MSLLPRSPDIVPDAGPRVVGVDSEVADDLMSALSSETARRILTELHEDPAPPAELADRADTTLQNAQYHLGNLEDAGAIEVVGTAYSEKGREMDVYAPADQPLVIFAGREESASGLRAALSRLLSGFAALALGSLVVQELFGRRSLASFLPTMDGQAGSAAGGPDGDGGGALEATATATPTPEPATETAADQVGGGGVDATAKTTVTATPPEAPTPTPADTATPAATGTPTSAATGSPTPPATGSPTPEAANTPTLTPEPTVTETATEVARETAANVTATPEVARSAAEATGGLPAGFLFFLGGALVLTVGIALTYGRR